MPETSPGNWHAPLKLDGPDYDAVATLDQDEGKESFYKTDNSLEQYAQDLLKPSYLDKILAKFTRKEKIFAIEAGKESAPQVPTPDVAFNDDIGEFIKNMPA